MNELPINLMVFNGYIILRTTNSGIGRISKHITASPQVVNASAHHVHCGPAVVPAGCAPVPVQAVLEGVDGLGLLHKVWKCIVVPNSSGC